MIEPTQNIFAGVSGWLKDERIDAIVSADGVRIERIVSTGQASPPGFWYDQDWTEWVMLLSGSTGLLFEDEAEPRVLGPGDHVTIPAHARHRVEWTDATQSTVWLAVHYR
jgi:cupin 2 domain-containing protein